MSAVNPQLGSFVFDDGVGPPEFQATGSSLMSNPGGGGPAAVLVASRAVPFTVTMRGSFVTPPIFSAMKGTIQTLVKDSFTMQVYVQDAVIKSTVAVIDPTASFSTQRWLVVVDFTLVSLT